MSARCEGCGRFAGFLIAVGDGHDEGWIGPCCASQAEIDFEEAPDA